MARRLIATGTTNADGKAAYTYTSSGAGKIDIVAEAIIDGRTYVSETYALQDYIIYDDGVNSQYDNWNSIGNPDIARGTAYTQITTDGTTTANVTHATQIQGNFEMLIELQTPDTVRFGLYGGSGKYTRLQINTSEDFRLWKIRRESGVFTTQISTNGGQSWTTISYYEQNDVGTADCTIQFYIPVPSGNPRSVKFKNLKVTSI